MTAAAPVALSKKNNDMLGIFIGILLLAVLGVGGYFGYKKFFQKNAEPAPIIAGQNQVAQPETAAPAQPGIPDVQTPATPAPALSSQSGRVGQTNAGSYQPPKFLTPSGSSAHVQQQQEPAYTPPAAAPSAVQRPVVTPPAQAAPKHAEILKPQVETPAPPARTRAYSGPPSGVLLWSGRLEKNGAVAIDGQFASMGSLTGGLPGVPVMIDVDQREFALAETPSPSNGWKRLVIRSLKKRHSVVTIKWTVMQSGGPT